MYSSTLSTILGNLITRSRSGNSCENVCCSTLRYTVFFEWWIYLLLLRLGLEVFRKSCIIVRATLEKAKISPRDESRPLEDRGDTVYHLFLHIQHHTQDGVRQVPENTHED